MADSPAYDPFDASMHEGEYPAELYRWMRNERPLYRNDEHDFWALSRFSDVQTVSRDWQSFSSAGPRGVDLDGTGSEVYGDGNFLEIDPPRHDLLRDIVRRTFSAKEITQLEASARARAASLFASLRAARGGDIGADLCWPLAFDLVMQLLGVPVADRPHVDRLLLSASARSAGSAELPAAVRAAAAELRDYTTDLVCGSADLAPGILQQLASARAEGLLSDAEAPGIGILLMFAGIEAPAIFAANAVVMLSEHPDQREKIRAGEVATEAAVEELIRFQSTVQALARTTVAPIQLHGVNLPAGATVLLVYGAANRDERRWDAPDTLDLTRPHQRNLAFGEGLHFCLGAMLARLETRVVVETLLTEVPEYAMDGPVTRTVKWCDWGVLSAPIAW